MKAALRLSMKAMDTTAVFSPVTGIIMVFSKWRWRSIIFQRLSNVGKNRTILQVLRILVSKYSFILKEAEKYSIHPWSRNGTPLDNSANFSEYYE